MTKAYAVKKLLYACLAAGMLLFPAGCAADAHPAADAPASSEQDMVRDTIPDPEHSGAVQESFGDLAWLERIPMQYAKGFTIDCYEGGYQLLTLRDGRQILTVPEEAPVPSGLPQDLIVLQQPADRLYLLASASMDMFAAMGMVERIGFCGLKAEEWYIPEAREAMQSGQMRYAGKYSAPDYEMLLQSGCRLAIENTMITHMPEVAEKLTELGIPVIIDYASYESHPLGRMEWIRFYGALCGCGEKAEEVFAEQVQRAGNFSDTGKTVAFFYIRSDGVAVVRRSDDYVPEMIRLAGGHYIPEQLEGENRLSTENMQMEAFYAQALDADYLVYNGTTTGEIHSLAEMLEKSDLLANFRAVKEGHVYAVSRNLYQSTMSLGTVIADLHGMMEDAPEEELVFLEKLE